MPVTFEKEQEPVLLPTNGHPILKFIKGDYGTRLHILTHHPQVEGFIFIHKKEVQVAYHPKLILSFHKKKAMNIPF